MVFSSLMEVLFHSDSISIIAKCVNTSLQIKNQSSEKSFAEKWRLCTVLYTRLFYFKTIFFNPNNLNCYLVGPHIFKGCLKQLGDKEIFLSTHLSWGAKDCVYKDANINHKLILTSKDHFWFCFKEISMNLCRKECK